jgi:hypothetical protein
MTSYLSPLLIFKMTILFGTEIRFGVLQYRFIVIYEFDKVFDNSIRDSLTKSFVSFVVPDDLNHSLHPQIFIGFNFYINFDYLSYSKN